MEILERPCMQCTLRANVALFSVRILKGTGKTSRSLSLGEKERERIATRALQRRTILRWSSPSEEKHPGFPSRATRGCVSRRGSLFSSKAQDKQLSLVVSVA